MGRTASVVWLDTNDGTDEIAAVHFHLQAKERRTGGPEFGTATADGLTALRG